MRTNEQLIAHALAARGGSYAPYSRFRVGAALMCPDGRIYTGANVENVSFGASICAERAACIRAVNDGRRDFSVIAIASDGPDICLPCGVCRQFLVEFAPGLLFLCGNERGEFRELRFDELLPNPFARF